MDKLKKIIIPVICAIPLVSAAIEPVGEGDQAPGTLGGVIVVVSNLISSIIPVIVAIALVVFLWGIISYITAGDDVKKKEAARGYMIYGIIGLFVMVSVWGLVKILQTTFVGETGAVPDVRNMIPK